MAPGSGNSVRYKARPAVGQTLCVLDGLDQVDWAGHTHAFGEASDVPVLLRAVALGGDGAQQAVNELFGTVWHQGTVYDVTPAVVPFLGELAASEEVAERDRLMLLALLFAIGRGSGYWHRHAETISLLGKLPDDLDAQLTGEDEWVGASRAAVAHEASKLIARIGDFPDRLWLAVAVLMVVAGEERRSIATALVQHHPPLPPLGDLGLQALSELAIDGELSSERVAALSALDDELDYFVQQLQQEDSVSTVTMDSYFVDMLAERLCDTNGH